jgi:hypothetical protein
MDERLKVLMQELGNAINESINYSDSIAAAIVEIRQAGYDIFLAFEVTVGYKKRDTWEAEKEKPAETSRPKDPNDLEASRFEWNSRDDKFLRTLRIDPADDKRRE